MSTRELKANATVLGLRPGDTFKSNDKFYDTYVAAGYLSVVGEPAPVEVVEPAPVEEVSEALEAPVEAQGDGGGSAATGSTKKTGK